MWCRGFSWSECASYRCCNSSAPIKVFAVPFTPYPSLFPEAMSFFEKDASDLLFTVRLTLWSQIILTKAYQYSLTGLCADLVTRPYWGRSARWLKWHPSVLNRTNWTILQSKPHLLLDEICAQNIQIFMHHLVSRFATFSLMYNFLHSNAAIEMEFVAAH